MRLTLRAGPLPTGRGSQGTRRARGEVSDGGRDLGGRKGRRRDRALRGHQGPGGGGRDTRPHSHTCAHSHVSHTLTLTHTHTHTHTPTNKQLRGQETAIDGRDTSYQCCDAKFTASSLISKKTRALLCHDGMISHKVRHWKSAQKAPNTHFFPLNYLEMNKSEMEFVRQGHRASTRPALIPPRDSP